MAWFPLVKGDRPKFFGSVNATSIPVSYVFFVCIAVSFSLNYSDVGGAIARYLDKIDSKTNNESINIRVNEGEQ